MTNGSNSHEEQQLRAQADQVRGKLGDLAADLRVVDGEVESLAPRRRQYELLEGACGSLEKLGELGAASLFWGERMEPARVAAQLHEVRGRVSAFQVELDALQERRRAILALMGRSEEDLEVIAEDLYQLHEAEERRKLEWVVERDVSPLPRRIQVMAWTHGGEDDWRFRKSLAAALLVSLLFGGLLPMIDLPLPARFAPDDAVSKRLAQLVRQEPPKPAARPAAVDTPDPTLPENPAANEPKPPEVPLPKETPTAMAAADMKPGPPGSPGPDPIAAAPPGPPQQKVAQAGILAFRDKFASLTKDRVAPRLGAEARFSDSDDASHGQASTRSMLTTNTPGSSGGIHLASLSRSVGGGGGGGGGGTGGSGGGGSGGGGGIQGVQVGRATSAIAAIAGEDRPKARGGAGSARTDEEIQIVFDRYKASFYRLYNRELRNDPTLKGQMVLRLTIEPDGSVSMCALQSTDMNAAYLADQVVNRVRTINFGAKDVPTVTIVYPIDFLPAT